MRQIQHQRQPSFPWQVPTLVNTNVGSPYAFPWEPPQFRGKRLPVYQHQTEAFVLNPTWFNPGNVGQPWAFPWVPPHFPRKVPVELIPTEFVSLTPDTLPPHVEGISWLYPFDQPEQRKVRVELQQTHMLVLIPGTLPVTISGHAWMRVWEPPYFARRTKHYIHPQPAFGTGQFLPVPISGMAWYVAFNQPYRQRNNAIYQMSTSFHIPLSPAWKGTYSVRISGGAR